VSPAHDPKGRMMSKELWGVFFEDSGTEYLVAVFETEVEATSDAVERDMVAFSEALEELHPLSNEDFEEPDLADFEGIHYVEPIAPELADDARELLEGGVAMRIERE
jgi:hypothetical protein